MDPHGSPYNEEDSKMKTKFAKFDRKLAAVAIQRSQKLIRFRLEIRDVSDKNLVARFMYAPNFGEAIAKAKAQYGQEVSVLVRPD